MHECNVLPVKSYNRKNFGSFAVFQVAACCNNRFKPRLHDSHFGHGTLKFWHADPFFWARHSSFLSCKRKIKGPRAQNFKRAETSSGGSLGPPKNGSADQKLVTHAFCFSHCQNIVSIQTKYRGKCGQTKPYTVQELRYILYGHA